MTIKTKDHRSGTIIEILFKLLKQNKDKKFNFKCFLILFLGCNRTYYGDIGLTYSLELHRPKQDRLPYICVLTFTAAGGQHGDVVQVRFRKISFNSF